ncbi:TolC family protein [Telmatobacter bradus]|uniref:TolC family protein n=1 Tax=Telmatobacter bradus TaxID=474953 RepID=UPI003B435313
MRTANLIGDPTHRNILISTFSKEPPGCLQNSSSELGASFELRGICGEASFFNHTESSRRYAVADTTILHFAIRCINSLRCIQVNNLYAKSVGSRKWQQARLPEICITVILGFATAHAPRLHAQCQKQMGSIEAAAVCATGTSLPDPELNIDSHHPFRLEELIDLAEQNHPESRMAWELVKQEADRLGIARSAYSPHLAALAIFGDQRLINPFPEALLPRGYSMVEIPIAQEGLELEYDIFDFGKRSANVESSKALRLAAAAAFQRTNQDVAFHVVRAYYDLLTAKERLEAARQIMKTAQTTQNAAEAQLANGRATLPDVLNAKAVVAQTAYDLEASVGGESEARVSLREAIGVEPSDEIAIATPESAPLPVEISSSAAKLVEMARQNRPDLKDLSERLRAADAELKSAHAVNRPSLQLQASGAQSAIWPTADSGGLGAANMPIWSVNLNLQWSLFDGGQRRNQVRLADSRRREAQESLRNKQDAVSREVWMAYIQFRTAVRQQEAAETLLASASTSYEASFDAYRYGVKNLVDVVTAETQLAQARLAQVQARSNLLVSAINLEYKTGNLLRQTAPLAEPSPSRP